MQERAALEGAAATFRGKTLHMILDSSDSYSAPVRQFFGLGPGEEPCVFLADMRAGMKKYRLARGHLVPLATRMQAQVEAFERKFFAGELTELGKGQPEQDDDPAAIVDAHDDENGINLEDHFFQ